MLGLASFPSFLSIYPTLLDAFSTSLLLVFDRSCFSGLFDMRIETVDTGRYCMASVLPPLFPSSRCIDSSFRVCFIGSSSVE